MDKILAIAVSIWVICGLYGICIIKAGAKKQPKVGE